MLYQLTGRKWGNLDVENETGCGIVPYTYKGSNLVNAVQWAVGLELLLLIDDPWRIFLTTDHPNGACFWRYPEIIHLLMNADFRRERVRALPEAALSRIFLDELDREYTLTEIAIITSAGPARALGMKQKGHLGIGADADLAIYNEKPDGEMTFRYPRYVIKAGELAVEEGEIRSLNDGHTGVVVQPAYNADIEGYLRDRFEEHYTISFENYPVDLERVHGLQMAECSYQKTPHTPPHDRPHAQRAAFCSAGSGNPRADHIAGLDNAAICALPVFSASGSRRVDDFFAVEGDARDGEGGDEIEIRRDAAKVKWIGRAMTRGRLKIVGNAGMHLGAYMKGGSIEVTGHASDWVGGEMTGGQIHVHGNTGGQVGAAYRGSMQGMRDGTILIGGSAGLEVGMRMRRGMIVIKGPVRDFAGLQMKGGTIILCSGAEIRTGAWMIRGTIISLKALKLLPTFPYACTYNPEFVRVYARHLQKTLGLTIPYDAAAGGYERYCGDTSVPGKGEILVWRPRGT